MTKSFDCAIRAGPYPWRRSYQRLAGLLSKKGRAKRAEVQQIIKESYYFGVNPKLGLWPGESCASTKHLVGRIS